MRIIIKPSIPDLIVHIVLFQPIPMFFIIITLLTALTSANAYELVRGSGNFATLNSTLDTYPCGVASTCTYPVCCIPLWNGCCPAGSVCLKGGLCQTQILESTSSPLAPWVYVVIVCGIIGVILIVLKIIKLLVKCFKDVHGNVQQGNSYGTLP